MFEIDKIIESASKINIKGGFCARILYYLIFFDIFLVFLTYEMRSIIWLFIIMLIAFLVLNIFCIIALFIFVSKHPHIAILDGAEFVMHERIVMANKNSIGLNTNEQILTTNVEKELPIEEQKLLNQPDTCNEEVTN